MAGGAHADERGQKGSLNHGESAQERGDNGICVYGEHGEPAQVSGWEDGEGFGEGQESGQGEGPVLPVTNALRVGVRGKTEPEVGPTPAPPLLVQVAVV